MRPFILGLTSACLLGCVTVPAMAQDRAWDFEGTFYLFTAETKTGVNGNDVTLSFKDALENLDMAFMAAFAASRGPWTFAADYMLTDLSSGFTTPGNAFSDVNASVKTQILSAYGLYQVFEDTGTSVDVGAGFRWFKTDTDLDFSAGALPATSVSENDDWIDPLLAVRANFDLNGKWSANVFADYGGFVSDRETWQVLLTANYDINDAWRARIGYRYMSVENDEDGRDYFFEQSGPVFGISYRF